jgi:hypothetical protein
MIALVFLYMVASIFIFGGELNAAILRAKASGNGAGLEDRYRRARKGLQRRIGALPRDLAPNCFTERTRRNGQRLSLGLLCFAFRQVQIPTTSELERRFLAAATHIRDLN